MILLMIQSHPTTLLHRLADWARTAPQAPAQKYKAGGEWKTITAAEYLERVFHLGLFLESKGVTSAESGAIFAYNSPQWVHTELGLVLLGARSAGLYPNSTQKDILYILEHTEATVLAVQNQEYLDRITAGGTALPQKIRLVLYFEGACNHPGAISYETALAEGRKLAAGKRIEDYLSKLDPHAGLFMIYTSGTTGNPKGALLSNDNFCYTSNIVGDFWKLPSGRGSTFSFLPLCHVAEKIQNLGVGISQRYTVSFATKFENVGPELAEVQASLLLCVPRLWEKIMEGVESKLRKAPPARQKLARWALGVGARAAEAKLSGKSLGALDQLQLKLADKLVLGKVRQAIGMANVETAASGAAALAPHITRWFRSIGIYILEDFGQTESTGVICMTPPDQDCAGSVGQPLPGTEFKLADDGEILTRGRHVFVGYFKDAAATAATVQDGWLHTGDLGKRDDRGMIRISGRKKEILKTSGGKMVAPLPIEERLKAAEIISQVCMVGDGRKFLSALITLTETKLLELKQAGKLNGRLDLHDQEIVGEVRSHVDTLNRDLASYEQIKKFTVLSREFSIVDGEMTPTLKMKRNIIEKNFRDVIESMYGNGNGEAPAARE